jgi:hypothetical protein
LPVILQYKNNSINNQGPYRAAIAIMETKSETLTKKCNLYSFKTRGTFFIEADTFNKTHSQSIVNVVKRLRA